MRLILLPLLLAASTASAKPKAKETAAPPPPPPPAAEPAPAPPPPVEEPPPPPAPSGARNLSMTVTVGKADGSSSTLKVVGVERSVDFQADQGWSAEPKDLKISVEVGSTEKMVAWTEVKSISVAFGKMPDEVDCTYSSDFSPWMYECTLRTTATVVLKDGSKGVVNNRHKWRFTMDDGSNLEFWLFKHTEREQDEASEENEEDFKLYTRLQDRLRTNLKGSIVKSVTVQ